LYFLVARSNQPTGKVSARDVVRHDLKFAQRALDAVASRVVLLAHWTSDVIAGLAIGAATERLLRRLTGYGRDLDRP
jgi:hypothetical protein